MNNEEMKKTIDTEENKDLRVLYKEVNKAPVERYIADTLEAKQNLVGGLIEVVDYGELLIICNEEGKILNLPLNTLLENDFIAGNFFVAGDDYENAGFKSLTDEEIEKASKDLISKSFYYSDYEIRKNKEQFDNLSDLYEEER